MYVWSTHHVNTWCLWCLDQLPTQLDLILVRKAIHTKQLISERSSKVPYKEQHLNYRHEQTSNFYPFLCICSQASLLL